MAKKKHHKFHSTHIEHHKDGSHTVHHMHEDGKEHDVKHGVGAEMGLDGVHDSLQDHLGAPNPGEAETTPGGAGAPGLPAGAVPVTAGA
jgi:flavin-dependent dehydrogenase